MLGVGNPRGNALGIQALQVMSWKECGMLHHDGALKSPMKGKYDIGLEVTPTSVERPAKIASDGE